MSSGNLSIPEFYAGKTVAITGGTGFVGQCVIEKLLRSCPDVKKILVLLRSKRSLSAEERLKNLTDLPIFDNVRNAHPGFQSKLVAVPCDLEKDGFGLGEESLQLLQNETNIFLHSAATVKFTEHLRIAFRINTLVVRTVINLCRGMKNLHALVHVSTAYSFCNQKKIREEVYEPEIDYGKLLASLEVMTDSMVEKVTPDFLGERPNTYTLTKALGEDVMVREGSGLPLCIVRPSIIGASYDEPIQGWSANLNGASGIIAGCGKGIIKVLWSDARVELDLIPSEFVVNGIIAAGWKTGRGWTVDGQSENKESLDQPDVGAVNGIDDKESKERISSVPVYHLVICDRNPVTVGQMCSFTGEYFTEYPVNNSISVPVLQSISNKRIYQFAAFFVEYIPACILDLGLLAMGKKPKMKRFNSKAWTNIEQLHYFMSNQWSWDTSNTLQLFSELNHEDKKTFNLDVREFNWPEYMRRYVIGLKRHLFKEDLEQYPAARRRLQLIRFLGYCCLAVLFIVVWRFLVSDFNGVKSLWNLVATFGFTFIAYYGISSSFSKTSFFSLNGSSEK